MLNPKDRFVAHASVVLSALSVKDAVPSGHIYAALMSDGTTYDEYVSLISTLIGNRLIKQTGQLLSLTETGKPVAEKVNKAMGWTSRAD